MVRKEGAVMTNSHSEAYNPNPSLGEEELAVPGSISLALERYRSLKFLPSHHGLQNMQAAA